MLVIDVFNIFQSDACNSQKSAGYLLMKCCVGVVQVAQKGKKGVKGGVVSEVMEGASLLSILFWRCKFLTIPSGDGFRKG